jgi:hypothetical protein
VVSTFICFFLCFFFRSIFIPDDRPVLLLCEAAFHPGNSSDGTQIIWHIKPSLRGPLEPSVRRIHQRRRRGEPASIVMPVLLRDTVFVWTWLREEARTNWSNSGLLSMAACTDRWPVEARRSLTEDDGWPGLAERNVGYIQTLAFAV